jgi:hypothetical protein
MAIFEKAIGPFFTGHGLHAWNLFLATDAIVALRYSFSKGLRLGMHLYCGFPPDPGERVRQHPESLVLASDLPIRYYPLTELQTITGVVSHGMNHIRLAKVSGGSDRYDIPKRPATTGILVTLRAMYPIHYREEGVPTTLVERVLKS